MLAAVAGLAATAAPKIVKGIFTTPSEKRAANVLPSVVQSALAGNLTAWRCLDERRFLGIDKERAVWSGGWNQVSTQRPDLLALYNANKGQIPTVNNANPEAAAASVLAQPFTGTNTGANSSVSSAAPALAAAGVSLARTPLWVVLVLAGAAGYFAFKKLR